ncbi:hypothetical protein TcWFU_010272 [Taenia crassiceps]|uniref:Uncharacterized protein n=1 Tax=Taenia crassiceps TaxID=6207 RepID=A0ABR4Q9R7_9CEST
MEVCICADRRNGPTLIARSPRGRLATGVGVCVHVRERTVGGNRNASSAPLSFLPIALAADWRASASDYRSLAQAPKLIGETYTSRGLSAFEGRRDVWLKNATICQQQKQ